ncbi:hypothetical protein [Ileibacterium valens]|uniref:hypothetical protein n=1 Tax=Ileibacterium valens TaxID=1862668 RepID=UPI002729763C|nr:hypothetical protein [Ileibacterium valens]
MMAARLVWGTVMYLLLQVSGGMFSWQAFLSGALLNSISGIIIQLTLIPAIMVLLDKTGLVPYKKVSMCKA